MTTRRPDPVPVPQAVEPDCGRWPAPAGTRYVVLPQARTSTERRLVEAWVQARKRDGDVLHVAADVEDAVSQAGPSDDHILPVGISWLTADQQGGHPGARARDSLRDAATAALPTGARTRNQERLLARSPDRVRLLVGAPARVSELRARWSERSGEGAAAPGESSGAFVAFVGRQADIAIERTERALRGDRYRRPRAVVEEVLTSRDFQQGASTLAHRLERAPEGVLSDARAYLEEMASEQQRVAIDLWARLSRALHSRAYTLQIDPDQLARLRKLSADHALVFLPSHRSNLDGYVMTSVTYDNGLPHNHVLGGINMAFWPLGTLGRRAGVIYIRRSFRDNEVYRFTLSRYLRFLVSRRFNLLWAIEGGRSRTGKLLPPRLGLFNYLADAVEELDLKHVLLVPTSIVYDVLNEARETTSESRGAKKQAESLLWLVRFARMQRGNLGSAHVSFADPINLAEALSANGSDPGGDPAANRLARSKVAFEVCTRINRATVVTAPALLSFALLGVDDRALTVAQIRRVVTPILDYVELRGIPTDVSTRELRSEGGLARTLAMLEEHGVVARFSEGSEPVYSIGGEQALVAAFYRNATIHWFVGRAIVELAVLRAGAAGSPQEASRVAREEAFRLRDLLKFEFFFAEKDEFAAEMLAELALLTPAEGWVLGTEGWPTRGQLPALAAPRVLRSFLEAYRIVADHLRSAGSATVEEAAAVRACLGLGRQYRLQRKVTSEEAISTHLFQTALKLAANRDLLRGAEDVDTRRAAFAAEVDDLLKRLDQISQWGRRRGPTVSPPDAPETMLDPDGART